MWSSKTYSATFRLCSCRMRPRSLRSISTSPLIRATGTVDIRRQMAVVSGLFIQWLLDPDATPDQRAITDGVLRLADQLS